MDFREYMVYRADEDCHIGVIAFDLSDDKNVPFESTDEVIFEHLDKYFKTKVLRERWQTLKLDYLQQKN